MRPREQELETARNEFFEFLNHVFQLPIFQDLEKGDKDEKKKEDTVYRWREFPKKEEAENRGHLLLRPVGQIVLADAVGTLVKSRSDGGRGMELQAVFDKLTQYDQAGGFEAHRPENVWLGVTYDSMKHKMITTSMARALAHDLLVYLVAGMEEEERQQLWVEFATARLVDREEKTWRNLRGEVEPFDESVIGLPNPI
jgi:hypothetical protein